MGNISTSMRVSPIVKEIKLLRKEVHASSEKLAEIQEKGFEKLIEKDSEDKKVKKGLEVC